LRPNLNELILRAYYAAAPVMQPGYARGREWCRKMWRLPVQEYERQALARLFKLVSVFKSRGISLEPDFEMDGGIRGFEDLCALPVLTREKLRELFAKLKTRYDGNPIYFERGTGGSTGEPVYHFRSKLDDDENRGATHEAMTVVGWRPWMKTFSLWGSDRDIGIFAAKKSGLRRFLDPLTVFGGFSPTRDVYIRFLETVKKNPGCAVYGFSGLLEECCRIAAEEGISIPRGTVKAAWVGAEVLTDRLRAEFARVFGAPIRDHYGSREASSIAVECEYGTRHVNPRYIVESQRCADLDANGDTGMLLVTDLMNTATPMIRYEIGDLGSVNFTECKCGRSGQALPLLVGRRAELVELPSGRKTTPLFFNHLLKEYDAIRKFQVARIADFKYELRYCGGDLDSKSRTEIIECSRKILEEAEFEIVRAENLALSPHGKLIQYRDERKPKPYANYEKGAGIIG
jgi:phenylacetate-CoA ligase